MKALAFFCLGALAMLLVYLVSGYLGYLQSNPIWVQETKGVTNMPDLIEGEVTYSMRGNAVVIHRPFGPFSSDIVLDESNLRAAIENIKRNRADYTTEEAWLRHLVTYQGALWFAFPD